MRARSRRLAAVVLVGCALASPARGVEGEVAAERATARGVQADWTVDGAITGGALVLWGAAELASSKLGSSTCRWCEPPAFDDTLSRDLRWSNPSAAGTASDLLVFAMPAAFLAYDVSRQPDMSRAAEDALVVAEAVALTGVATEIAKYAAARQRPYAHHGTPTGDPAENTSFWSGHAAVAFALAAASGRVAQLRDDPAWPWVYAVGFTAATGVSYLRLAAEKHYPTDVLVGAAVGTAFGLVVPTLHARAASLPVRVAAFPGGIVVMGEL